MRTLFSKLMILWLYLNFSCVKKTGFVYLYMSYFVYIFIHVKLAMRLNLSVVLFSSSGLIVK